MILKVVLQWRPPNPPKKMYQSRRPWPCFAMAPGLHPALERRFALRDLGDAGTRCADASLALPEDARTPVVNPVVRPGEA